MLVKFKLMHKINSEEKMTYYTKFIFKDALRNNKFFN